MTRTCQIFLSFFQYPNDPNRIVDWYKGLLVDINNSLQGIKLHG